MNIEIITTPNETLKETGFGNIKACTEILAAINCIGYMVKTTLCYTLKDLDAVVARKPDLVILAVKYIPLKEGKDIWLSEYFTKKKINFSGSLRETLKYDSNKVLAKRYLKSKGLSTASFFTAVPAEYTRDYDLPLGYPLFLKPMDAANGNGVDDDSFVNSFAEYEKKVASLYERFKLPVLVESYLDGKEYTVAMIKTKTGELLTAPMEVIAPKSSKGLRILGEKTKRDDVEMLKTIEDAELKKRIITLAIDVFIDLGIRDFGRIDIKTNKNGHCFFMEANLLPGMNSRTSYFPRAFALEFGLSYETVIERIVEEGISRVPEIAAFNLPTPQPQNILVEAMEIA
jgi:D-alanine-D-alanine ligase